MSLKGKSIIFTGGGSGGHVVPALTLIEHLEREEARIFYVGGRHSIEKELVSQKRLPYKAISTGKLRRYFSWQNLMDLFKVAGGLWQAYFWLLRFPRKDTLVFSTGGFVSVPLVIAAKAQGKRVFIHEQTARAGLANRIAGRFADQIFLSFEGSTAHFPPGKTFLTGYPLRQACYSPVAESVFVGGIDLTRIQKPILFATGGGNGALLINKLITENLAELTEKYFIVHQTGKQFINDCLPLESESYIPVAFLGPEIIEVMKLAHVVVSRAGAGTVSELLAIGKKSIFIPLAIAQKNEQFYNAQEAKKVLGSIVVEEDKFNSQEVAQLLLNWTKAPANPTQSRDRASEAILEQIKKAF